MNDLKHFNNVIDGFFFFDILLGFRVTYRDQNTNKEIINFKSIARNYLRGEFWLDLVSTVPFELIMEKFEDDVSGEKLAGLSMVKMTRVLRIQKLIMYLNSTDEIKNTLNLVKTVLTIILYLHIKACLWFFIANEE